MGIYKRMNQSCGTQSDLYASVKEDGSKAVVHSSFGTKVYKKVDAAAIDNDLWLSIKSNPKLTARDLIPYIDALGNYIFLTNKPKINGVTLEGDKSTLDLKIFGQVDASGIFFNDGETLQEKYDNGDLGVNKYPDLKDKPTINGVVLNGDLTTASLGIINDDTISTVSAWSSRYIQEKLNSFSVTTELIGTDEEPVVAADLKLGSYIISGKIRSSLNNATTIRVPRKQYMVNRDIDGVTVLWDANPYTKTQYYIVFKHEGIEEPSAHTIELLTKESIQGTVEEALSNAKLDCGEF
jgi:hypothetical protein